MKKTYITWLLCFATVYSIGQDFCYYDYNNVCYDISATKMLVKSDMLVESDIKNALRNTIAGNLKDIRLILHNQFLIEMDNSDKNNLIELVNQWNVRDDVLSASPVFLDESGYDAYAYTNEIIVRIKTQDDYPVLQNIAEEYQISSIERLEFDYFVFLLTIPRNSRKNALDIATEMHESGLFVYADPNFTIFAYNGQSNIHVNEQLEKNFRVFPNPANDVLYIDLNKAETTTASYDIALYDNVGRLCRQANASRGIVEFNIATIHSGICFLTIYDEITSKTQSYKIVIRKHN